MHLGTHGITDRGVDHAVSLQRGFAGEGVGDDMHAIMTAALRPRMAGMPFALIFDLQVFGCKRLRQAFAQMAYALFRIAQGRTFLKGRTVTRA